MQKTREVVCTVRCIAINRYWVAFVVIWLYEFCTGHTWQSHHCIVSYCPCMRNFILGILQLGTVLPLFSCHDFSCPWSFIIITCDKQLRKKLNVPSIKVAILPKKEHNLYLKDSINPFKNISYSDWFICIIHWLYGTFSLLPANNFHLESTGFYKPTNTKKIESSVLLHHSR